MNELLDRYVADERFLSHEELHQIANLAVKLDAENKRLREAIREAATSIEYEEKVMSDTTEFARAVKEMRDAQNQYFRDRSLERLRHAKTLEFDIDAWIARILDRQGKLFEEVSDE